MIPKPLPSSWRPQNIETRQDPERQDPQSQDPQSQDPERQDPQSQEVELPDEEVTATAMTQPDSVTDRTTTATKTDTPIFETPASIAVVPQSVLKQQLALGLEDVYVNVSGVAESGNTLNAQSEVLPVIRGFESRNLFRNGMRVTGVGAVDVVNIESVEVLKGPASILYGAVEPGGIVNYTTKRPQDAARFAVEGQVGSFDHYRAAVDLTGPINENETLLYRVTAAFTDSGSFRDRVGLQRFAVAPSLTWRLGEDTDLFFDLSYARETGEFDSGVPFGADGEPLVSIESFFGDDSYDGRTLDDLFAGIELSHRFDDNFALRSRFQFHRAAPKNESIRHAGVVGAPGAEMLRLRYQNEEREDLEYQLVSDLTAEFDTGPVHHQGLLGLDLRYEDSAFDRFRENLANVPIVDRPSLSFPVPADNDPVPTFEDTLGWAALYAQDQLSMLDEDRLHVLLGARLDYVDLRQVLPNDRDETFAELSFRVGVLFEATDWMAPYASFSEGFQPPNGGVVDRAGDILDPETSQQIEAGLKFETSDQKAQATISVYEIEKEGVPLIDNEFLLSTGQIAFFGGVEQRSRGVEVDVVRQLADGLNVIANYAYADTETSANPGDPAMVGLELGGVPDHVARVWASYDFLPDTTLEGLGFGAGVRYEADRFANFDPDITLDSFVVFDAGLWYDRAFDHASIRAQLNVQNIADEEYYPRAADQSIVHPGRPRSVLFSLTCTF
ncbi:MAG: TonB-dependent siderophore receptor [Planctomycetota bacterium]